MKRHPVTLPALAVALVAAGVLAGYFLPRDSDFFTIRKNFQIFGSLYEELVTEYVDDVDSERLMRAGIDAMLQRLDPYTSFMDEADHAELDIMSRGRYFGIGLSMGMRDGELTVVSPVEGAGAFRQGVRAGDVVTHIGDRSTDGLSLGDARGLLRGEPGTTIDLTIRREGVDAPLQFTLMRERVQVKDVSFSGFVHDDTARGIGYIKLDRFAENAAQEVRDAAASLHATGHLRGLVLDLRDNPGGLLDGAVGILQLFVPEGTPVVRTSGKAATMERTFRTQHAPLLPETPLAVIINENSASASEIVAGAVQDLDRGVVVGATSFGKGLVQTIRRLPYNTAVKMTTGRYYIPSGRSIQNVDYSQRDDAAASPVSPGRMFETAAGRPVRDAHGIEPDVPSGDEPRSELEEALDRRAAFFLFANHFAARHESVGKDFDVDDAVLDEFRRWLDEEDFHYRIDAEQLVASLGEELDGAGYGRSTQALAELESVIADDKSNDFRRFAPRLKHRLRTEILSRYMSDSERIRASFGHDEQLADAVRILEEPDRYASLLSSD